MIGEYDAEIARSKAEADARRDENLLYSEHEMRRYGFASRNSAYSLEYAFSLIPARKPLTCLDFGAGAGENSVMLSLLGHHVTAIDISHDLLTIARQRAMVNRVSPSFLTASAVQVPLADHSFDIIFGAAILHHLDLGEASREVCRLLKPGGSAIFVEPVRDSKLIRAFRKAFPRRGAEISPDEYPLTDQSLQSFAGNLQMSDIRKFRLPHLKFVDGQFAYRLDRWLLSRFDRLEKLSSITVFRLHG